MMKHMARPQAYWVFTSFRSRITRSHVEMNTLYDMPKKCIQFGRVGVGECFFNDTGIIPIVVP